VKKKAMICSIIVLLFMIAIGVICEIKLIGREVEDREKNVFSMEEEETLIELYGEDYVYSYVDIYKVVQSKEFSEANERKKMRLLKPVLKELKKSGRIKEYKINMDNLPPSVDIVGNNDVDFTVLLDEFPVGLNGLN